MEELWSDREEIVMLSRAHLSDDENIPNDPRDWNIDD